MVADIAVGWSVEADIAVGWSVEKGSLIAVAAGSVFEFFASAPGVHSSICVPLCLH